MHYLWSRLLTVIVYAVCIKEASLCGGVLASINWMDVVVYQPTFISGLNPYRFFFFFWGGPISFDPSGWI